MHTYIYAYNPPCAQGCNCCNLFIISITFNSLPSVSLCVLFFFCVWESERELISEYDGTLQSQSIPLCLLQKGPWSSFYAQESSVSRAHVKKWVSMMHQGDIQISFHPPGASRPLFIWLLGCSVNDISSTITQKRVWDTDTTQSPSPHKVQGLALLWWDALDIGGTITNLNM